MKPFFLMPGTTIKTWLKTAHLVDTWNQLLSPEGLLLGLQFACLFNESQGGPKSIPSSALRLFCWKRGCVKLGSASWENISETQISEKIFEGNNSDANAEHFLPNTEAKHLLTSGVGTSISWSTKLLLEHVSFPTLFCCPWKVGLLNSNKKEKS